MQLGDQQTQIDAQQKALDDQQQQLEALVGLRTRIITSLSSALKEANISAQVDRMTDAMVQAQRALEVTADRIYRG